MAEKPLVLSDDMSLVGHDLSSVLAHFSSNDFTFPSTEVKFKKKETVDDMAKSLVKHRIQALTGKNVPTLEAELGKPIEKVEDLRRLAKLLLLEAFGKLPFKENTTGKGRKRVSETAAQDEPVLKRGRKSLAVPTSGQRTVATPTRSRRSMLPSIPVREEKVVEEVEEEDEEVENEEDQVDLSELGPNPTPQMIELKKKQARAKKSTPSKVAAPLVQPKKSVKMNGKKAILPAKSNFPGNKDNAIYLVTTDVMRKEQNAIDFTRLQNHLGDSFKGANLTFIHPYADWSPADIFSLVMNVKLLNRKAKLESFLVMLGCGISNIHLFREALYRQTKHVQLVVFEKQDMVITRQKFF